MAEYGKAFQGKEEIRKEMCLIAMAHRTAYVLNGSISNPTHLIEGYVQGLNSRRPAIFNVYSPCMPEHGIGDDVARQQAKLAVESRAFPLYRFNPDKGKTWVDSLDLEGNPSMKKVWPSYTLNYVDAENKPCKMTVPTTFADFAVTEGRFRKQFKKAPANTWNESMAPIADFLDMTPEERKGKYPFVWTVDKKRMLGRMIVAEPLVKACEERRDFWALLKSLAQLDKEEIDVEKVAGAAREAARAELIPRIAAGLMELAGNETTKGEDMKVIPVSTKMEAPAADCGGCGCGDFTPATIDAEDCTACGECIEINSNIFGWNDDQLATVINAKGGPFKDIVKAAEKCPARVIHPGTPADPNEKDLAALVERADKFN
jgi:pyruvate-ferredoxin/flavodoxin oxidoreductase